MMADVEELLSVDFDQHSPVSRILPTPSRFARSSTQRRADRARYRRPGERPGRHNGSHRRRDKRNYL